MLLLSVWWHFDSCKEEVKFKSHIHLAVCWSEKPILSYFRTMPLYRTLHPNTVSSSQRDVSNQDAQLTRTILAKLECVLGIHISRPTASSANFYSSLRLRLVWNLLLICSRRHKNLTHSWRLILIISITKMRIVHLWLQKPRRLSLLTLSHTRNSCQADRLASNYIMLSE